MNSIVPIILSVSWFHHCWERTEYGLTEFAIDSAHKLVDNSSEILIFFDVFTTGDSNLDQDNFPNPFRMLCEEDFQGMKLLRNTLDVVQSVDTNDDLDSLKPVLEGPELLQYRLSLQTLESKAR